MNLMLSLQNEYSWLTKSISDEQSEYNKKWQKIKMSWYHWN